MQVKLKLSDELLKDLIISKVYRNWESVFSQLSANSLPPYQNKDHAIELEPEKTSFLSLIYNLFQRQLKTIRKYIDENFANRFICFLKCSAKAPVLFILRPDSNLLWFLNYRRLNVMTIKNQYLFPLIGEILNRLIDVQVFTKINVKHAYYCL